jgi:hypothetical protein
MYVCMYGTYTNSHFWTDLNQTLHTSPPWSERDRRVCMNPKFVTSSTFWTLFFGGHCRVMGTRWLPVRPFSAIHLYPWFQLMFVWRHRHDVVADGGLTDHPRQPYIRDSSGGVPLTLRKWCRSRRQSHPPQCRIPYSSGCSRHVTAITWRRGHPPQRYIPHSSSRFCDLQEITFLQTTVACSYSKCVALLVMRTIRRDVNGIHVSTVRNLIRREGSD